LGGFAAAEWNPNIKPVAERDSFLFGITRGAFAGYRKDGAGYSLFAAPDRLTFVRPDGRVQESSSAIENSRGIGFEPESRQAHPTFAPEIVEVWGFFIA
jgi:hypothetical protein